MIVSFTGHRPNKLSGYKLPNPTYIHVCQQLDRVLREVKPDKAISGGALGIDQYAANICFKMGIPVIFAIPFLGQEKAWPEASQKTYHKLLDKADEVVIVCEGGYAAYKMQVRNEWMVNHCDVLVAVFIPTETNGGTYNAIQYAKSVGKEIIFIDPAIK
jgi:uncharacterized phage-like protein YoqJ